MNFGHAPNRESRGQGWKRKIWIYTLLATASQMRATFAGLSRVVWFRNEEIKLGCQDLGLARVAAWRLLRPGPCSYRDPAASNQHTLGFQFVPDISELSQRNFANARSNRFVKPSDDAGKHAADNRFTFFRPRTNGRFIEQKRLRPRSRNATLRECRSRVQS